VFNEITIAFAPDLAFTSVLNETDEFVSDRCGFNSIIY
jgi:hypothetical protein